MYDFLRPGVRASNAAFSSGARIHPGFELLGNDILRSLLEGDLLSRLLDLDGFVGVTPQGRLQCRNLFGRGKFDPAACDRSEGAVTYCLGKPVWSRNPIYMKSKDDAGSDQATPDRRVTPRYIAKNSRVTPV